MASSVETFQVSCDAADVYETHFVPRLFAVWARHLVEAAGVETGQTVLDVACGTGIVAREAASLVGGSGKVAGLDMSENMLSVARRVRGDIEWHQADAAALPFPPAQFDTVLCQSGLMFFPDRVQALREMARVAKPAGTIAVQVWGPLAAQPAYVRLVEIAARHAGPDAVNLLGTYWCCGEVEEMRAQFREAGLEITRVRTLVENMTFDSTDELVRTEVESTPLMERISSEVYDRILAEARVALDSFVTTAGDVEVPLQGHLFIAKKI